MVELQIINHILATKSLKLWRKYGVTADFFTSYQTEYEFMLQHEQKYGCVPDSSTFLDNFPEFDLLEVDESEQYLLETLNEEFKYKSTVPVVQQLAKLLQSDAEQAVAYMREQVETLSKLGIKTATGTDIVRDTADRRAEAERRFSTKGLLGIPTGIDELDELTHGFLPEDFVVLLARTNQGKTWLLLFFLYQAWKQRKKVLLYSGEMSAFLIATRLDTLHGKFGNRAITGGSDDLGEGKKPADYFKYLEELSQDEVSFIVITPRDLGGKRLDIPKLHQLIEEYEPDIVGIDQLSLMDDYRARKDDPSRLRYTHISEDLYLTSEKYQIPVLSPAQANREASKESKKDEESLPDTDQIAESDGVGQNATRVISMGKIGQTMKVGIKKNRYGEINRELLLKWAVDEGIIEPLLKSQRAAGERLVKQEIIGEDVAADALVSDSLDGAF